MGGNFFPPFYVCCEELAVDVVVLAQLVHCLQQLVGVNQGTDADQGAQDVPAPEGAGAKAVADAAALQLVADSCADLVVPDKGSDAEGQPGEDEGHQQVMGGLLAIVTGSDGVDVIADRGPEDQGVDAKGHQGQQNQLNQTSVGLQLSNGSGRGSIGVFHNSLSFPNIIRFYIRHANRI